jgi:hypothetical protein
MKKPRNYKRERQLQIARGETGGSGSGHSMRGRARRAYEKAHGDLPSNVDVDHKKPVKAGGSNAKSNLRVRTEHSNAVQGGTLGDAKAKGRRR